MAELYRATLYGISGFEKPMVLKKILPQYARNADFIKMFIDEAKISVLLSHGNIIPVYELGRVDESYFIAMEYVHGKNLSEILGATRGQQERISVEHAIYISIEICKGLAYAHQRTDSDGVHLGIVHRDINPANIMVSFDGEVKIADFGIATARIKLADTHVGFLKGTCAYMSPEQARGERVDHRTDIFSTGSILYEMVAGRPLFRGVSEHAILDQVRQCEILPISTIHPDAPWELDPILFRVLAEKREERYEDAASLQMDFSRLLFSVGGGATAATLSAYLRQLFPLADEQTTAPVAPLRGLGPIAASSSEISQVFATSADFSDTTADYPKVKRRGRLTDTAEDTLPPATASQRSPAVTSVDSAPRARRALDLAETDYEEDQETGVFSPEAARTLPIPPAKSNPAPFVGSDLGVALHRDQATAEELSPPFGLRAGPTYPEMPPMTGPVPLGIPERGSSLRETSDLLDVQPAGDPTDPQLFTGPVSEPISLFPHAIVSSAADTTVRRQPWRPGIAAWIFVVTALLGAAAFFLHRQIDLFGAARNEGPSPANMREFNRAVPATSGVDPRVDSAKSP
jgi:hypothetical protein